MIDRKLFVIVFLIFGTFAYVAKTLECITCSGNSADPCTTKPTKSAECEKNETSCFTSISASGILARGCTNDTASINFKTCKKSNCNNEELFWCKTCNASNPDCAQVKREALLPNAFCNDDESKCFVKITEKKGTERGCAKEECGQGILCETCDIKPDNRGCNNGIFPKDRRLCYQCPNCENLSEHTPLPCPLYDSNEECFVYASSTTGMTRGCSSNTTEFEKCTKEQDKCLKCASNNCNNATKMVQQNIKCIQCGTNAAGCPWGHSETDAKDCKKPIEYWQKGACYTLKVNNSLVERGCLYDNASLDCKEPDCSRCTDSSGCNNKDVMNFTCYKCRSDNNPKCAQKLDGPMYGAERCENAVSEANKGCYTERYGDLVIRSCLVDADFTTRKQCEDPNYKACRSCPDKDCNKDAPPNSATSTKLSGLVIMFTFLVISFINR